MRRFHIFRALSLVFGSLGRFRLRPLGGVTSCFAGITPQGLLRAYGPSTSVLRLRCRAGVVEQRKCWHSNTSCSLSRHATSVRSSSHRRCLNLVRPDLVSSTDTDPVDVCCGISFKRESGRARHPRCRLQHSGAHVSTWSATDRSIRADHASRYRRVPYLSPPAPITRQI